MAYDIILQVLLVLASAVLVGETLGQLGFPSVAGELLSGMILGPTLLGVVIVNAQTEAVSSIALFFVVFLIGFEMTTATVRKLIVPAALVSATSFFIPLVIAVSVAIAILPFGTQSNIIVALGISVPSISIISILVMELNLLEKKSGQLIISSVTVADIVAFLILATISRSASATFGIIVYTAAFIVAFVVLDWWLNSHSDALRRLSSKGAKAVKGDYVPFALLLVCGLFAAALLQYIGISYIMGAFLAGLIVHDGLIGRTEFRRIADTLSRMNKAFFIPVFFGFAGAEVSITAGYLGLIPSLALIIAVSVIPATVLTYFASRRILGDRADSRHVAFILSGRGSIGIVIVSVALSEGLINNTAYSLAVLGTLVVSLAVPALAGTRPERMTEDESDPGEAERPESRSAN